MAQRCNASIELLQKYLLFYSFQEMGVPYNLFYVVFSFWIVHELLFCNTPNRPVLDFSQYLLAQGLPIPRSTPVLETTVKHGNSCF